MDKKDNIKTLPKEQITTIKKKDECGKTCNEKICFCGKI